MVNVTSGTTGRDADTSPRSSRWPAAVPPPPALLQLSAGELLAGYARRDFSPVDVVRDLLARVDELNDVLQCFVSVNTDDALRAAADAERQWAAGSATGVLCGVPVSLKDSIEMAGLPTTYGSAVFATNDQPDSEIARRLRHAGAVLIGKTNLPEFALCGVTVNRLGPPGRNPWNLARSCGGSSGGAGAAVAAGLGPLAVGTDSGGSIRCPAAYNGVFGLKPSYQRIPSVQQWRAGPGRSHNGPITRTVDDAALLMDAIAGPHPLDPESALAPPGSYRAFREVPLAGRRVAVAIESASTPWARRLLERAAARFDELGCDVDDAAPPAYEPSVTADGHWPYAADHYAAAEALAPGFWERHRDELTDYARPVYDAGRTIPAWQYRLATAHDAAYRRRVASWFADQRVDVVISESTGVAPPVDADPGSLTRLRGLLPFNIARNPAASVPFGFSAGLPVAVQVVGRVGDDVGVLHAAASLEDSADGDVAWDAFAADSRPQ
jgi:aspartyl-tRNA(Asn)/glutamyl-tRNA(Gln) amidotransferase subunit A